MSTLYVKSETVELSFLRLLQSLSWVALVFATQAHGLNSFLVAPGSVEIDMDRPRTQSFIVTNTGTDPIRVAIKPIYVDPVTTPGYVGGREDAAVNKLEDITEHVRVSPRTLRLNPGQRRDVRVSLRPPQNLPEGDYRTGLLFAMKEVAYTTQVKGDGAEGGMTMGISMKFETIVKVIGHNGERVPKINAACDSYEDGPSLLLSNETVWRYDGWANFYADDGRAEVIHKERLVSPRQSKRQVLLHWQPEAGKKYVIDIEPLEDVPAPAFSISCAY